MSDPLPLSRPVSVARLAPGSEIRVDTTREERAALAARHELPAVHALTGRFRIGGTPARITVRGDVRADIDQTCVVTLEPFRTAFTEDVELSFVEAEPRPGATRDAGGPGVPDEIEVDPDAPDPIENGRIDFGAITAEFFALGLDPYPRKPGAAFSLPTDDGEANPFAALAALKPQR